MDKSASPKALRVFRLPQVKSNRIKGMVVRSSTGGATIPLWPLPLPGHIVAIQCLREMRVCPDPAHLFIDVFRRSATSSTGFPLLSRA